MTLVLGLETSGRLTGAALVEEGRLIAESSLDVWAKSQETLLAQVDRVLREHGRTPRQVTRLGVAVGPGSFTGLRVGIAAAQGLCLGLGIPAVSVPSHRAMALPFRGSGLDLVFLTGERRGTVMLEGGAWQGMSWEAWLPAACVPVDEVRSRIESSWGVLRPGNPRVLFIGEAVESLRQTMPSLRAFGEAITDPLATARRPGAIALLASEEGAELLFSSELHRLEPLYLRAADAKRPGERATIKG